VEWLGDIPKHWELRKLKYIAHLFYGDSLPVESRDDGDVPVYGSNGVVGSHSVANTLAPCLIVGRKGSYGKVAFSNQCAFAIDTAYFIDRRTIQTTLNLKWLFYALSSLELDQQSQDTGVPGLSREFAHNKLLSFPSLEEQGSIANFLDRETTCIDTLITKKCELINLLEKKRNAVIANAVTKGLNSNASMTDSKIEWLGKIPKHWKITRLKFISPQITVGIVVTPAKYYVDSGVPCLRSLNVKQGKLIYADIVFISSDSNELHRKSMIFEGDLVVVRTGQPGATAVVDKRFHGANCIDLIIVRQSPSFNSHYLSYLANSNFAQTQFELGSGGAIQQHFNVGTAANLQVLAPPLVEQQEIVNFLNNKVNQMNNLINKVQESINLLQQQRSALVTAAVTGKIDVREEVERGAA
jgi:type I restriction enzyme S subunit